MAPVKSLVASPAVGGTYPVPGTLIENKYVIEEEIGSGGMGVVVAARHAVLQQRFAIKFLVVGIDDPETVRRFILEARAASELKSEHVVRVHDVGELPTSQPYMVMEYLEGDDLGALIAEQGPLRITQAVNFVLQACEAVAEAHAHGIVHRDIKPRNLFRTTRPDGTDQIKVMDFGVSKIIAPDRALELTDGRSLLGSPYYMSPEQVRCPADADARSDIWSMGATLYELLTGQRAFQADSLPTLSLKIVNDPFVPPSKLRSEIPQGIDAILRKCLAKDPDSRYQTAAELASALSPFAGSDARIAARRAVRILRQSSAHKKGVEPAATVVDAPRMEQTLDVRSDTLSETSPTLVSEKPRVAPLVPPRKPWHVLGIGATVTLALLFGVGRFMHRAGTSAPPGSATPASAEPSTSEAVVGTDPPASAVPSHPATMADASLREAVRLMASSSLPSTSHSPASSSSADVAAVGSSSPKWIDDPFEGRK